MGGSSSSVTSMHPCITLSVRRMEILPVKLCLWSVGPCNREGMKRLQGFLKCRTKIGLGEMNFDTYSSLSAM